MENNDTSFSFWKRALGCSISVETLNKQSLTGRLYVVDPQSNTIVLVKDDKSLIIIPGHAVNSINTDAILFDEQDVSDFLNPLRKGAVLYSQEELYLRKEKLKQWLQQNGLDIEDNEGGTLKCQDYVFIEAPYNPENCLCSNVILLERIRGIMAKIPAN